MTPKITIGMPVRNGGAYLEAAVRSLLTQTEPDFLLHISDNCSDDDTAAICARLAAEDARIRYERQARDIGAARNFEFLLRQAQSPYFLWAAHDDLHDPTFLAESLQRLEETPDAVACAVGLRMIDEEGAVFGQERPPTALASRDAVTRAHAVLQHNAFVMVIYGLMRRDALPPSLRLGNFAASDIAFTFGAALRGPIVTCDRLLFSCRTVRQAEKRQGQEAHLYGDGGPWTQMYRAMARDIVEAPLTSAERARLRLMAARLWVASAQRIALGRNAVATQRARAAHRDGVVFGRRVLHFLLAPGQLLAAIRRRVSGA